MGSKSWRWNYPKCQSSSGARFAPLSVALLSPTWVNHFRSLKPAQARIFHKLPEGKEGNISKGDLPCLPWDALCLFHTQCTRADFQILLAVALHRSENVIFAFSSPDTLYNVRLKTPWVLPHRSNYFVRSGVKLITILLKKWFLQYSALTASHLKLGKYKSVFILMCVPEGNIFIYSVKWNLSLWF